MNLAVCPVGWWGRLLALLVVGMVVASSIYAEEGGEESSGEGEQDNAEQQDTGDCGAKVTLPCLYNADE